MKVTLSNVAKHFTNEVVFTGLDHVFEPGSRTAVLGPNGSGKSTFLQVVAGALVPTAGRVEHAFNGQMLDPEQVYRHVSIAAPYLHLYEELSLRETLVNHIRFKPLRSGIDAKELARIAYLQEHLEKPVRNFSSGMKQRLKLALAILSDTPLLLLDEPTSNLDAQAIGWYGELLRAQVADRTLLVASNRQEAEYALCTHQVDMQTWKAVRA